MNDIFRTLPGFLVLAILSVTASAETITVCADGCDYPSINAAIAAASDGDVIQLAAETYFEGEPIDPLGKAITLRGVLDKAGKPASVLDGAGAHRVLICQGKETSSTVFEYLRIKNGDARGEYFPANVGGGMFNSDSSPTLTNCVFEGNSTSLYGGGGGMYNLISSPTLTGCVFEGNWAFNGGGMFNRDNSSPTLTNCTFTDNSGRAGGGMCNAETSIPTLSSCTFTGNSADTGGGMRNSNSSPSLTECTFAGNSANSRGGGMFNLHSSSPTLAECTFTGNSAAVGGGMWNFSSSPTLTDCTFTGNWVNGTYGLGGGMCNAETSIPTLADCTFTSNSAAFGGGMHNGETSIPTLDDCTLCENVPDQIDGFWADARDNCVATSCDDCDLPSDPCPTDLDENSITDGGDLGAFFVHWGDCLVEDCPADFNDDEVVDGIDLGILFSAWGPCQ